MDNDYYGGPDEDKPVKPKRVNPTDGVIGMVLFGIGMFVVVVLTVAAVVGGAAYLLLKGLE